MAVKLVIRFIVTVIYQKNTVLTSFQRIVKKKPDKPILYFQDTVWTVKEVRHIFSFLIGCHPIFLKFKFSNVLRCLYLFGEAYGDAHMPNWHH